MVDRPILFSGPMVRALLEGRKTQTRRVVKPQPVFEGFRSYGASWAWHKSPAIWFSGVTTKQLVSKPGLGMHCPYGQPGDLLWVRETWGPCDGGFCYRASERECVKPDDGKWHPAIHMFRAASRLTLRITDVRVERLTAISDDDIWAEGVQVPPPCSGPIVRSAFAVLWDSINGAGSFDANPWVWALTFEVVPRNIDSVLLELANAPEPAR